MAKYVMERHEFVCNEVCGVVDCSMHIAHVVVLQVDGQHLLDPGVGEKEVSCC